MSGRIFIDSNILLCLFEADKRRKSIAASLVNSNYFISTQVVNENVSVCLRKLRLSNEEAIKHGIYLLRNFEVLEIGIKTIESAFQLLSRHKFSFWDCLILAAAIEGNCDTLFSEDMQHKQVVDKKITIINPFL